MAACLLRQPARAVAWPVIANRTCRILRAGVAAGMLHRDSLELAAAGCGNHIVAERYRRAGGELERATIATLDAALEACDLPRDVVVAIATADRSGGSLDHELERQIVILDERVAERMEWAGKVINGSIYTAGVIAAAIAIISMMSGYVSMLNDVMG